MDTRFQALSQREKLLVLGLGLLLAGFVIMIAVVQPIQAFEERTRDRFAAAQRMVALAETLETPAAEDSQSQRSLRSVVTESARQRSLVITRINASGEGVFELNIAGAPYGAFYTWLDGLRVEESVSVQEAFVTPGDTPGTLDVRLTLSREG